MLTESYDLAKFSSNWIYHGKNWTSVRFLAFMKLTNKQRIWHIFSESQNKKLALGTKLGACLGFQVNKNITTIFSYIFQEE